MNTYRTLCETLIILAVAAEVGLAQTTTVTNVTASDGTTVNANTPNVILGRELVVTTRQIELIQAQKRFLATLRNSLETLRTRSSPIKRSIEDAKESHKEYQAEFTTLKDQNAGVRPIPVGPPTSVPAFTALIPDAVPLTDEQLANRWQQLRDNLLRLESKVNELEYRVDDLESGIWSNDSSLQSLDALPTTSGAVAIAPFIPPMMEALRRPSESSFGGPTQLSPDHPDPAQQIIYRTEECTRLLERIITRLASVEGRFTPLDQRLTDALGTMKDREQGLKSLDSAALLSKVGIEGALSERDQSFSQYRINLWLVGAVFAMVVSIVLLFLFLWLYPATLTGAIIEHRVFIEVLSMAFLLLTVIILGTGKLLDGQGLAGLLGTIAGYIFARKTAELGTRRNLSTLLLNLNDELMTAEKGVQELEENLAEIKEKAADTTLAADKKPSAQDVQLLEAKLAEQRVRAKALRDRFDDLSTRQERSEGS